MTEIILSPSVSWKFLPWIKISQKIFILQEKIYKFSKQCNQYKVHHIQDYMINSSDIQLFLIQKLIDNLNRYYYRFNKKKYKVKDIEKLYIYQNLFDIQNYKKSIRIILEYIKQYLVYICIKPEWKARFEPMYKLKLNILQDLCCIYETSNSLSINGNTKYLLIPYFIKRIQSLQSIKLYINYWLNYQIIENSLNLQNIYYSFYPSILNYLKMLIHSILLNGLEWYLMYTASIFVRNHTIFKGIHILVNEDICIKIYFNYYLLIQYNFNSIRIIDNILKSYYLSFLYENFKIGSSRMK
uniref:hypothetical protein n=1 Tax=Hypnea flava TaxID=1524266 RepID=UPI0027DA6C8D|nr:hypothetical protein REP59_pgp123 [Hypnea flava]WCH54911.1 hypothetical protein [Hypnea flava]